MINIIKAKIAAFIENRLSRENGLFTRQERDLSDVVPLDYWEDRNL